jgi:predicted enzyme related to lactoylglutathione lyase
MNAVQVDQKSYEMPPREGISIAHFLTVADVERSARYYEKVFGAHILTLGDGNAPPYLQLANIWITVADIDRSADFYEKVFGGRILSRGDSKGASRHIQIANTWLIVNIGGGPTPDKPSVTLSVPDDPDKVSSFLNVRVADIQACL